MLDLIYVVVSGGHFLLLFLQKWIIWISYQFSCWAFGPFYIILFQFLTWNIVNCRRLKTDTLALIHLILRHLPLNKRLNLLSFAFIVMCRLITFLSRIYLILWFHSSFYWIAGLFDYDLVLPAWPFWIKFYVGGSNLFLHVFDTGIFRAWNQQFLAAAAFRGSHEFLLWRSHLPILYYIRIQGRTSIYDFRHVTHGFGLKLVIMLDHISLL